jgi:hypothetical protein
VAWRCAWCSRDRAGRRRAPAAVETTGICEPCLGKRRARGFTERGAAFLVWELDRAEARRWADELRAVAGEPRLDK